MIKEIEIRQECCNIWNNLKDKNQMIDYLIESKLQLADLEAKLDEKTRIAEGYCELFDKKQHENYEQFCEIQELKAKLAERTEQLKTALKDFNDIQEENDKLAQQLAEKDQAIENWKTMYESVIQTCNNDAKEIDRLREQLHTANQETLHFQNKYFAEKQIAIEELDKVKVKLLNSLANVGLNTYCEKVKPVENYIDQQIRVLKGEE